MSFLLKLTWLLIITISINVATVAAEKPGFPVTNESHVTPAYGAESFVFKTADATTVVSAKMDQPIGGAYSNDIVGAEGNDSTAQDLVEKTYQRGRMAFLFGNYDIAFKIWRPLANKGFAKAQATLGWMYHTGKGVKKNLEKAMQWYIKAAKQQHAIAQNNLGVFHEQGLGGIRKNLRLAAKWYREAADDGYAFAQYNLGILYHRGRGVEKNIDEAIYWLQIAALQGVKQAQAELEKINKHRRDKPRKSVRRAKNPQWIKN